jgi:hypothetical protein
MDAVLEKFINILNKYEISFSIVGSKISVDGSLDLRGTSITALPDNLSVDGYLDLSGTSITALPDNLSVGGSLYLPEKLTNVAYKHKCGQNGRTIFAAWIGGEIKIGAGCFLGNVDNFFAAVDEKYSGDSAVKYKKDAQECVDSLVSILALEG